MLPSEELSQNLTNMNLLLENLDTLPLWGESITPTSVKEDFTFSKKIDGPRESEDLIGFFTRYTYTRMIQLGLRYRTKNGDSNLVQYLTGEAIKIQRGAVKAWKASEKPSSFQAGFRFNRRRKDSVDWWEWRLKNGGLIPSKILMRNIINAATAVDIFWDEETAVRLSERGKKARAVVGTKYDKYSDTEAYRAVQGMSVRKAAEYLGWSTRTVQKMRAHFENVNLETGEIEDEEEVHTRKLRADSAHDSSGSRIHTGNLDIDRQEDARGIWTQAERSNGPEYLESHRVQQSSYRRTNSVGAGSGGEARRTRVGLGEPNAGIRSRTYIYALAPAG